MRTQFTQSARKHKIGRAHALFVMETTDHVESTNDRGLVQRRWAGADSTGRVLEIVAVIVDDGATLLVFHVMPDYRRNR